MANAQYFQWPADSRQRSASLVCVKTKTSNEWRVTIGHRTPPCTVCCAGESCGNLPVRWPAQCITQPDGKCWRGIGSGPGLGSSSQAVQWQYWCCSWKVCGNPLNTWAMLYFGGSKLVLLHITFWITQNHLVHNWAWGLQSMFLNDR